MEPPLTIERNGYGQNRPQAITFKGTYLKVPPSSENPEQEGPNSRSPMKGSPINRISEHGCTKNKVSFVGTTYMEYPNIEPNSSTMVTMLMDYRVAVRICLQDMVLKRGLGDSFGRLPCSSQPMQLPRLRVLRVEMQKTKEILFQSYIYLAISKI